MCLQQVWSLAHLGSAFWCIFDVPVASCALQVRAKPAPNHPARLLVASNSSSSPAAPTGTAKLASASHVARFVQFMSHGSTQLSPSSRREPQVSSLFDSFIVPCPSFHLPYTRPVEAVVHDPTITSRLDLPIIKSTRNKILDWTTQVSGCPRPTS